MMKSGNRAVGSSFALILRWMLLPLMHELIGPEIVCMHRSTLTGESRSSPQRRSHPQSENVWPLVLERQQIVLHFVRIEEGKKDSNLESECSRHFGTKITHQPHYSQYVIHRRLSLKELSSFMPLPTSATWYGSLPSTLRSSFRTPASLSQVGKVLKSCREECMQEHGKTMASRCHPHHARRGIFVDTMYYQPASAHDR